jgi:hypothetical protein
MDDLILAGALSIAGLYVVAALAAAAFIVLLTGLYTAIAAGEPGRAAVILGIVLLFFIVYDGTGFWLQKTGRI